jgi:hypothetical protein
MRATPVLNVGNLTLLALPQAGRQIAPWAKPRSPAPKSPAGERGRVRIVLLPLVRDPLGLVAVVFETLCRL